MFLGMVPVVLSLPYFRLRSLLVNLRFQYMRIMLIWQRSAATGLSSFVFLRSTRLWYQLFLFQGSHVLFHRLLTFLHPHAPVMAYNEPCIFHIMLMLVTCMQNFQYLVGELAVPIRCRFDVSLSASFITLDSKRVRADSNLTENLKWNFGAVEPFQSDRYRSLR